MSTQKVVFTSLTPESVVFGTHSNISAKIVGAGKYSVTIAGIMGAPASEEGGGGGADHVYGEILTSANNTFSTLNQFRPTTTRLYLNGQRLRRGASHDYIENSTTSVTYNFTLPRNPVIEIDYEKQV